MVSLTNNAFPRVDKCGQLLQYESLHEGSSWLPRQLGSGGKWSRRTNKHHEWSNAQMNALKVARMKNVATLHVLFMSLTMRRLQFQNMQKKHNIYWRRHIRKMIE